MSPLKPVRYGVFGLLYYAQGMLWSYFSALNALYFLSKGLSIADVGVLTSIASIPLILKFFFGLLSDKVNLFGMGHRKPYILLGLFIQSMMLVIAPFIDIANHYWWFVVLAFFLQVGMALYDTSTDGLAVDIAPPGEQGVIQGIMISGRALGIVTTASFLGVLAQYVSWYAVFWVLAAFTLVPVPFVLRLKEPEITQKKSFEWSAFRVFLQASVWLVAFYGILVALITSGPIQLVNPFLQHRFQISLSEAGFFGTVMGIGQVLGGVLGSVFSRRLGNFRTAFLALMITVLSLLFLSITPDRTAAWFTVLACGLAISLYQTSYLAYAMRTTQPQIAASMFSIMIKNRTQFLQIGCQGFIPII